MKSAKISGKWQEGMNSVKLNLPVMIFEEEGSKIAYIPVLDLSGYGSSENEAVDSLKVVLDDYFSYTTRKKTLLEDLKKHGWIIKKTTKPFVAPEITDILNKNKYLHEIINTRPYRMDRMSINVPNYA
jgi:hypothetical protein